MKEKRVVAMGGSFNPPTMAHLKIMQASLDAIEAERGFFVPVSFPYLKRKMVKAGQSHLCLPNDLRLEMIEAMIASDDRIRIFTDVMGDPFSDDVGFMKLLREKYPDADIYYVAGDDKLALLDHFAAKSDFFDCFRCILFARDHDRLTDIIADHEHLAEHVNSFVPVTPPDGVEGISSTVIREHLFDIDTAADMLHPDVLPLLRKLKKEDYPKEILQFREEYAFLSNDYPAEITYEGRSYPCVTSALLASKSDDIREKKAISKMRPDTAKQKYSAKPGSEAWEEQKTAVMEELVRLKFVQHPDLREKLVETGNRRLVNGGKSDKTDLFWGVSLITWEGSNLLGSILMKIRSDEK